MLPRVLEPEVMDTPEEAHDYDSMDHATVNRVFVADFVAVWDGGMPILDVGTGTAQIPVELCRQAPAAEVIAVDLAEARLDARGVDGPLALIDDVSTKGREGMARGRDPRPHRASMRLPSRAPLTSRARGAR